MKTKSFISVILSILISLSFTSFAAYDDAGTDYSSKSSDTWIQDRAGEGLKMVNSFVCIVKSSNGGTRPNASWKALIDELKCELKQADEAGSGAVEYAEATIISTRASDTSNQELKTYFNSADGSKYIASMSLNNSTDSIFDF